LNVLSVANATVATAASAGSTAAVLAAAGLPTLAAAGLSSADLAIATSVAANCSSVACAAAQSASALLTPTQTAVIAAVLNTLGVARAWYKSSLTIHNMVTDAYAQAMSTLAEILAATGGKLEEPLREAGDVVDGLMKEQLAPALGFIDKVSVVFEAAKKLSENAGKASDLPELDVPTSDDLERPIKEGLAKAGEIIEEAKTELPKTADAAIRGMIAGRVLLSQKAFVAVTVGVPSFLLLAINLYMAGAFELGPESQGDGAGRMLSEEGEEGDEDADYFGPVLTQIGLAFVQMSLVYVLGQKRQMARMLNMVIGIMERKISDYVTRQISHALDAVFEGAFGKLRDEMEMFFPPMLEVLETLRELLGAPEGKKGKGAPGAKRGCGPVPCVLL
jgi:hypothetical protein